MGRDEYIDQRHGRFRQIKAAGDGGQVSAAFFTRIDNAEKEGRVLLLGKSSREDKRRFSHWLLLAEEASDTERSPIRCAS